MLGEIPTSIVNTMSGLGLVPNGPRPVTPVPAALKKLVPLPTDQNITVKASNADTLRDTIPLMLNKIKRTKWQSKELANALKAKTLSKTARNNWDFIFNHIQYKEDERGKEQLRSPRRLIHEGVGDCDCFSATLGTLLLNQGIPGKLRITKYASSGNPNEYSHVYVVVPKDGNLKKDLTNRADYIVLDPVVHQFDYEVPFSSFKDFPIDSNMRLQFLDGPPSLGSVGDLPSRTCGDPIIRNAGNDLLRVSYLKAEGYMPTDEFLASLSFPFVKKELEDGAVRFIVKALSGENVVLPPILSKAEMVDVVKRLSEKPTSTKPKRTLGALSDITIPGWVKVGGAIVGASLLTYAIIQVTKSSGKSKSSSTALSNVRPAQKRKTSVRRAATIKM